MTDCVFCKIVRKEIPAYVVYENDTVIVFMSLSNHPMVVTKKHCNDIFDLDDASAAAIMQVATRVAKATKQALGCEGINLIQSNGSAAGQTVFHFHLHIKPRFKNDGVVVHWDDTTVVDAEKRSALCASIQQAFV